MFFCELFREWEYSTEFVPARSCHRTVLGLVSPREWLYLKNYSKNDINKIIFNVFPWLFLNITNDLCSCRVSIIYVVCSRLSIPYVVSRFFIINIVCSCGIEFGVIGIILVLGSYLTYFLTLYLLSFIFPRDFLISMLTLQLSPFLRKSTKLSVK